MPSSRAARSGADLLARSWVIGEEDAGERLDIALAALAGITRSQARRWIDDERVSVNARPCRASHRVRQGDSIGARPPEPLPSPLTPEPVDPAGTGTEVAPFEMRPRLLDPLPQESRPP